MKTGTHRIGVRNHPRAGGGGDQLLGRGTGLARLLGMILLSLSLGSACGGSAGNGAPASGGRDATSESASDTGAATTDGAGATPEVSPSAGDANSTTDAAAGGAPDDGRARDATGATDDGGTGGMDSDGRPVDAPAQDAPAADGATADGVTRDAPGGAPDGAAPRDAAASDAGLADALKSDAVSGGDGASNDGAAQPPFRVLLFSRTAAFRHASIPTALAALMSLQASGGYVAEATEDPTAFTATNLARFQVVVFALTSGDVLNPAQQTVFENWIAGGGGYVGIHSASDTEYDWPFYGALVGAYFSVHPAIQMATVRAEAPIHPVMTGVPTTWVRTDEWYNFRTNPRPNVTVVATLDESTYTGGAMGADHPIAWVHTTSGGGRAFYTALGHTPESYAEAAFRRHLVNGLRWVAQR